MIFPLILWLFSLFPHIYEFPKCLTANGVLFPSIVIRSDTVYNCNLLKFVKTCFVAYHVVCLEDVCTWEECIFCCFGGLFCTCLWDPILSLLIFVLVVHSHGKWGIKISFYYFKHPHTKARKW